MNSEKHPKFAPTEDIDSVIGAELVVGSSLWRDAWRRLLKNKLAVFGMIVVVMDRHSTRDRLCVRCHSERHAPEQIVRAISLARRQVFVDAPDGNR
ncbi:MAG: hypothetical protein DMF70_04165 [Acidobacteria bacterium]|nr:MAG: hypothetical protein DMF70_04165 [Acidobacteriota bacterium]